MTITEFLSARYDEGTAVALRIIQTRPNGLLVRPVPGSGQLWSVTGEGLLRDIEAKRAVLAMALSEQDASDRYGARFNESREGWNDAQDYVLKQLASVYADHPDYQQEWAPHQ